MTSYLVTNPANDVKGPSFDSISHAELQDVIEASDLAYRTWGVRQPVERAVLVGRVGELHTEHRLELAEVAVREMGKPISQALGEIDFAADIYGYYAENAAEFLQDETIPLRETAGTGTAIIKRSPLGVLLGIMPWNFPYYQVARFAAPNLAAGNTILLKPAPQCPESAAMLDRIFRDAGFPENTFRTIYATDQQIEDVIAHPRVQGVSLTGSERAGAAVAEIAGRHLKKTVLELGGSDPFIVLSTDDLDATVASAVSARIENSGQTCSGAKRFIVIDELYDAFLEKFIAELSASRPSDPTLPDAIIGPLSSKGAADRLEDQVRRAIEGGARFALEPERSGNYFSPGVLTDVSSANAAGKEEFFGPVAMVFRVDSEEEAVRVANQTDFGLGAFVFSTDPDQAMRVASQIESGMVYVNVVDADTAELPFGGVKRSGFGRELGRLGIEEFINRKLIRTG